MEVVQGSLLEIRRSGVLEKLGQLNALRNLEDPAIGPLIDQTSNHLQHISYGFRVARDSEDFPYEIERTEPFPPSATDVAFNRANRLIDFAQKDTMFDIEVADNPELRQQLLESQQAIVDKLMADPMSVYEEFSSRRAQQGREASFPELGATLQALQLDLISKADVAEACQKSPLLARLRGSLVQDIQNKVEGEDFGYTTTLWMIEDAMALFDAVVRVNDPESPPPYHSARFAYNWYSLADDEEITVLPTMASVNSEDLLKFRSVPVGIIGISTDTIRVDGFPQTPYEFFYHDVDHTRRMHEATTAAVEREGVSMHKFAEDSTALLHDKLLPAFDLQGIADGPEYDRRIAMRMTLFEILHEDGLDPAPDTIADAILRAPMERTPFERVVDEGTIEHFMAQRATTLAHVFRKLAHTFYDLPERRSAKLGTDFVRTRLAIAQGAADLYRLVSDDPIDDRALLQTCQDMVSTDEGFTDAFIGNIAHDIARQAVGRSALTMMVTKPLGVHAAVKRAKQERPKVHSLFGYSALEYEKPEDLELLITHDLLDIDPDETAIAIGATPYGIGRVYPILKQLGYHTLGIVASTAVGNNEACAEGVDEIIVVKDNGWGGYRYSGATEGLLSPTTRVFVGASDSIGAYGGGDITAVTLKEMQRRGKPWTYRPFDMNHKIARMNQGQKGLEGKLDYRGPAFVVANALERNRDQG